MEGVEMSEKEIGRGERYCEICGEERETEYSSERFSLFGDLATIEDLTVEKCSECGTILSVPSQTTEVSKAA